MTEEQDTIRAFIAIALPPEVQEALREVMESLRQVLPHGVRWVNAEGIHLTLKFLGNIEAGQTEQVVQAMTSAAAGFPQRSIELALADLGVFPGARQPRVVWAGVSGDLEGLGNLQSSVDQAMADLGFRRETRPFTPHLTLGRVQDTAHGSVRRRIGPALAATSLPPTSPWEADRLHLVRSTLTRQGASYSSLGETRLGAG